MTSEPHLILREITVQPAGEWMPPPSGWTVARIAEGVGYSLQSGSAREFLPGDGLVVADASRFVLRASQLGPLRLGWFQVQPQFLNGLITVTESHQLEQILNHFAGRAIVFSATDALGQKFARLAGQTRRESLAMRSALLQLWSQAVSGAFPAPPPESSGCKLRERFQKRVAQMPDTELATRSLAELAAQLGCSARHFSRIFRQEFGISLQARQTELRLQRASELLAASPVKIATVANESGYRHLGLFNAMFKKKFGMTPSDWRQKWARPTSAEPLMAGFTLLLQCQFEDMIGLAAAFVT